MSSIRRRSATPPHLMFALGALGCALFAGCTNPRAEANTAQALNDAATEINGVKSDVAALEAEIDSLRTVIAKQDTTIQHIAAVNNIPIVR